MLEVVNHLENKKPLNNIQGVGFRENGQLIINPQTDFIDLNSLPIPAWDLIDVKKILPTMGWYKQGLAHLFI
ncbi:MAG: hypothetical protein HC831_09330 [Chloroflexia bacterium]|nr:hypothetical protein [Chloroflexia bacterium]